MTPRETNERRAGGVSALRIRPETRQVYEQGAWSRGVEASAQPLGVETGEAWNAPLGDTWRSILTREGTIGGLRLA